MWLMQDAVGFGHVHATSALLRARCDPDMRTGDIRAPPDYGAHTLHETPLHLACRAKPPHLELQSRGLVLLLLRFGADPGHQDDRGDTPAHHLARKGDAATLWALLSRARPEQAEAAVRRQNARGATAEQEAPDGGARLAVRLALRCGPRSSPSGRHSCCPWARSTTWGRTARGRTPRARTPRGGRTGRAWLGGRGSCRSRRAATA
ncbi:unnamed protein product [Prorocentrum cordatum]|uniref:Uncharacterized protein n=1 Tax=Prorocentrum cordatum TaxID=2364126 RepID=A0ABN9R548_9DINO|nr:unnamed protein product [Polarella glacialis]